MPKKLHNIFYDHSHKTPHIPLMKYSIKNDRNFNVFSSGSFRNAITKPALQIYEFSTIL